MTIDPATGAQTVAAWGAAAESLGTARAHLGGFLVTGQDSGAVAAGDAYIYFGQGATDNNTSSDFDAALVGANGDLGALTAVGGPTPVRVGATDLQANGWLFMLGGANGNASNGNDTSNQVIAPAPTLDNWGDALGGGSMLVPRIYTGSSAESAFFFILGGSDGTNPLASIEQTIQ